jgi:hypothetical protein
MGIKLNQTESNQIKPMLTKHHDPGGRAIPGFPIAAASKELHDGRESDYSRIQFMGGDGWAWILGGIRPLNFFA